MRIQLSSVLLLPSLLNAGVLAKHCEQSEGQLYLAVDTAEAPSTHWNLTGYGQSSCGGTGSNHNGDTTRGCKNLEEAATPDLSYTFWGSGTMKACLYGAGGCSPGTFIVDSFGDSGLKCTGFPANKAAVSYSIVDGATNCLLTG